MAVLPRSPGSGVSSPSPSCPSGLTLPFQASPGLVSLIPTSPGSCRSVPGLATPISSTQRPVSLPGSFSPASEFSFSRWPFLFRAGCLFPRLVILPWPGHSPVGHLPLGVLAASSSYLVLKHGTDVVPNLKTVVWLGLPESFVHNLALSFAQKHLCRLSERGVGWGLGSCWGMGLVWYSRC